jgi:hypothetical protein
MKLLTTLFLGVFGVARAVTFEEWQQTAFTPAELLAPTVSARSADPDQDGRNNLMEFALGSDPKASDPGVGFIVARDALGHLTLEYTKWKTLSGTVLFPQITSDLVAGVWQGGDARLVPVASTDVDSERAVVTLRDPLDPESAPHRFIRFLADTDYDYDGLPDDWELHNGLSPYIPTDWSSDVDGDGRNALQEFLDGTDALAADVPPPAVAPPSAPMGVTVTNYPDGSRLIEWLDTSDNETFFRVVETLPGGGVRELGRVGPNERALLIPAGH